jgi:hypothetical protein
MNYSTTAIAYLIPFLALGYFDYRLFIYWKREKTLLSKLWFFSIFFFLLFIFIKLIYSFFFAANPFILRQSIYLGGFIQTIAMAITGYLIAYLSDKRIFCLPIFFTILIVGFTGSILTVFVPFQPFLDSDSALNWGIPKDNLLFLIASIIRSLLFLGTFIPMIVINLRQFMLSKDRDIKKRSLGLGLAFLFLVITALIDFLLINILNFKPIARDVGYMIAGTVLLISFLLTQKPSNKEYNEQ